MVCGAKKGKVVNASQTIGCVILGARRGGNSPVYLFYGVQIARVLHLRLFFIALLVLNRKVVNGSSSTLSVVPHKSERAEGDREGENVLLRHCSKDAYEPARRADNLAPLIASYITFIHPRATSRIIFVFGCRYDADPAR